MTRLTTRQRFIITATVVAAACFGAAAAFVLASKNARSARAALRAIETRIQTLEQKHASDIKTSQAFGRRAQDIERLRKFFVDPQRPLDLIKKIEDAARRTGNGVSLTLDQNRTEPKTLFFRVTLEGSDPGIASMLSLIDTLPYDIKVAQMNYEAVGERNSQLPVSEDATARARMILVIGVKTR